MSWCGGGEIRPTPGVEWRVFAVYSSTLWPGRWAPSPGFAALAGVRLAAEAVHRDRERLVRLGRERAERHRAGGEALDDLAGGLDLVERDRVGLGRAELE